MDERLQAFIGKPREFRKEEWKLTLKPFKGKQLDEFMVLGENPGASEIIAFVASSMKHSGYEVTAEDVEELDVSFINWVAECVVEINGFKLAK